MSEANRMGSKWDSWRTRLAIFGYFLRKYQKAYLFIVSLSLASGVLEAINMLLFLPLLQSLVGAEEGVAIQGPWANVSHWGSWVQVIFPGDFLVAVCLALLIVTLLRHSVAAAADVAIATTSGRVTYDTRRAIYQTYAQAPYPYFLQHKVGELSYNSMIPSKSLAIALQTGPKWFVELCRILGLFAFLLWLQPALTAGIILLAILLYLPMTQWVSRRLYRTGVVTRDLSTTLSAQITEFFTGIKQIRIANATDAWLKQLDATNVGLRRAFVRETAMPLLPGRILELITIGGVLSAILLFRLWNPSGFRESLALIGLFGLALMRTMPSFVMVGQLGLKFATFMPDVERLYSLLHEGVPRMKQGSRVIRSLEKAIVFEEVSFAYPGRPPIFSKLSLEFPKGRFSAIVGLSGSGKTTLLNLILGLHHPTEGRILIDGVDLREIDQGSWYGRIGYVSQDPFLFNGSVLENIRLFHSERAREDVERSAKQSLAHDFIVPLPQGYETLIGERGLRLSGGQQQRIVLARAILHNPDLLLLDEATSALDNESQRLVQEAIQSVSSERTVIAIAHRLSAIAQADRIYVIDQGRLAGEGQHHELLAANSYYQLLQP